MATLKILNFKNETNSIELKPIVIDKHISFCSNTAFSLPRQRTIKI